MKEKLITILKNFGIKSTEKIHIFLEKSALKNYPKNEIIFAENQPNDKEYILLSGVVHRFNFSEKGMHITTQFYTDGAVITPHFARTKNEKSLFSLQSLTEISMAEIPVKDLDMLRHNDLEFNKFGQLVVEKALSEALLSDMIFRSCTAGERLLKLRQEFPMLENLIPHHIIASYLGITNVSFSRLRKDLAKK